MKLSIITIAYNNAKGLERTLQSVASQTCQEYEEIVVDGGSSDNSMEIIKEYKSKISHFTWISEPDKGVYDAMNKGIRMASGEYCLFLNSGDVLANDSVLKEVVANNPSADIVCGNSIFETSNFHKEKLIISPNQIKASDLIVGFLPHQSSFIKKHLFEDIHLYDISFKIVSDWLFFIEAILVYNCSYQHINMFVSRCETEGLSSNPANNQLMKEEFHRGLKPVLPLYYEDYVTLKEQRMKANSETTLLLTKFSQTRLFSYLLKIRHKLLKWGWYDWKAKRSQRRFYKRIQKEDKAKKKRIASSIMNIPDNLLSRDVNADDIICSVTSYGQRVSDALPYMLYSLLTQTQLPKKIVVYLDRNNWNDDKLPLLLKKLQRVGVEFYYCEDIRSYKKLIPALKMFPSNPIITLDDDFYYYPQYIEDMTRAYEQSDKQTVLGQWGGIPEKKDGKYIPYNEWKDCKYGNEHSPISFFGCCCCYPPHLFDDEILKSDVFMNLCPTADDIWFWAMEERQNIRRAYIEPHGYGLNTPVNRIEEYDQTQTGTLFYQNVIDGKNNQQLVNVMEKYLL